MVITPNNKYLIACSEVAEKETPEVCVWFVEKLLEELQEPEKPLLKGHLKPEKEYKLSNWLLCVDAITTEIKGNKIWIVCAGSINGDVYLWSGDIDKISEDWNLHPKFFKNLSSEQDHLGAIFDLRIIEDKDKERIVIYLISNHIEIISKEKTGNNFIKELSLSPVVDKTSIEFQLIESHDFDTEKQWILSFDLFIDEGRKILITGSNDNRIYKWDLETRKKIEPKLGDHEDGVTCVKIFDDGNRLASGCLNNIIKVWDFTKNEVFELSGHTKEILSIDIQKDNRYLISASKDNTIKIWDLNDRLPIREIPVSEYEDKDSPGLDFLRQIIICSKDQYIFALKKDKILKIRNYGRIWHFCQQLDYIEDHHEELYMSLYGANLREIAERQWETEESLRPIYTIIKNRLVYNRKNKFQQQNLWQLGDLYIPSFIKFEEDHDACRIYIDSVRTNYNSYWFSANKMFDRIPDLEWQFKLFLTTDIEEDIKEAKFIEITKELELEEDLPYIILEDRDQSQIRFLMILENVPTTFIPLLKAVSLDVEDNRGDKDKLIFTDFKRSTKNFVKLLTKPNKSTEKFMFSKEIEGYLPDRFYYSSCIFKLDERYNTDFKNAEISIRKKVLEFTESLNPLESNDAKDFDVILFEAFRNHFHSPNTPKTFIQIGKGLGAKIGKIMDTYLARLVMLDFFFTIISIYILYLDILTADDPIIVTDIILFGLVNLVSFLIIFTLFMSIAKRKGSKRKSYRPKGLKMRRRVD